MAAPRKDRGARPEILKINGQSFNFYRNQRGDLVSIYRNENGFLRIGKESVVKKQLNNHKNFFKLGFDVPKILFEGTVENQYLYIESSIGDKDLGKKFNTNSKDASFSALLKVIENFIENQIRTSNNSTECLENFKKAIHLKRLINELPSYENKIIEVFNKYSDIYEQYPCSLSHGDFHLRNIFSKGIIDFEDSSILPLGYDIVSLIVHNEFFPSGIEYEYQPPYGLAADHQKIIVEFMDKKFNKNRLLLFSECLEAFKFARSIYMSVTHDVCTPNINQYRKSKFINNYLK